MEWRELVRASHEGTLGRTAAALQVDVSKMFDRICHALLVMAAKWSGFPLWLLRAALASYMWMRVLVLPEGVAGEPIWPRGGVVPGSAFAVVEVAMFLLASLLASTGTGRRTRPCMPVSCCRYKWTTSTSR